MVNATRMIHRPTKATSAEIPASIDHKNVLGDTTFARINLRRVSAVLFRPPAPEKYLHAIHKMRAINPTDQGIEGVVVKFAFNRALQMPPASRVRTTARKPNQMSRRMGLGPIRKRDQIATGCSKRVAPW